MSPAVWLQYLLPHALMARIVYRVSRSTRPWISKPLIRWFASRYDIDLSEAEQTRPDRFTSFNTFFTRALKRDARPLAGDERTVVSPADGRLTEHGTLHAGRLIQAKGLDFALADLLGGGPAEAEPFTNGMYATIYLAPSDYHRVHMPLAGRLTAVRYVPGRRFSVNAATTGGIPNLFCRNERVVCRFETEGGSMALVLIGALNVSSISLAGRGEIASGEPRCWGEASPPWYARGAEIGRFNLGSTVVVLFPDGKVEWNAGLPAGSKLRVGEAIGTRLGPQRN